MVSLPKEWRINEVALEIAEPKCWSSKESLGVVVEARYRPHVGDEVKTRCVHEETTDDGQPRP
jgi:hypothetical protein